MAVDNTFEQHLRHVLPWLSEDKVKLVMALQDKCHAKVLEARGKPLEEVNAIINDIIGREIRNVLGEQDFAKLFGSFGDLKLIDPKQFKPL